MKYLSLEEILYLHERIIFETGGTEGIRDFGLLFSAIERPKASFGGKDLYKSVFTKAAALIHSLILNHPFVDGNKRTGIAAMMAFLQINRIRLGINPKSLAQLALKIENKKMDINKIARWLKTF